MDTVDVPFEGLRPVALTHVFEGLSLRPLESIQVPFDFGQRRRALLRAHVEPDDAIALLRRIGLDLDLVLEVRLLALPRHVDAGAAAVEFPAVIGAANSPLLIAGEYHG